MKLIKDLITRKNTGFDSLSKTVQEIFQIFLHSPKPIAAKEGLAKVLSFFDADRIYIGYFNDKDSSISFIHERTAEGVDDATNLLNSKEQTLGVEGVFVFVGQHPAIEPFADLFEKNEDGFILADETTRTTMPGVFVAGDVRAKPLRQIATAVSDGAVAAKMAVKYIQEMSVLTL